MAGSGTYDACERPPPARVDLLDSRGDRVHHDPPVDHVGVGEGARDALTGRVEHHGFPRGPGEILPQINKDRMHQPPRRAVGPDALAEPRRDTARRTRDLERPPPPAPLARTVVRAGT